MGKSTRGRPRKTPLTPFGVALREAIASSRFDSREAFRREAKIPAASLYVYETDPSRPPRADDLEAWAGLLGVSMSVLAGAAAPPPRPGTRWYERFFNEWAAVTAATARASRDAVGGGDVEAAAAAALAAFDTTTLVSSFAALRTALAGARAALEAHDGEPRELQDTRRQLELARLRVAVLEAEGAASEIAGVADHDLTPLTSLRITPAK